MNVLLETSFKLITSHSCYSSVMAYRICNVSALNCLPFREKIIRTFQTSTANLEGTRFARLFRYSVTFIDWISLRLLNAEDENSKAAADGLNLRNVWMYRMAEHSSARKIESVNRFQIQAQASDNHFPPMTFRKV